MALELQDAPVPPASESVALSEEQLLALADLPEWRAQRRESRG